MVMNDAALAKTLEKALSWFSRQEPFTLAVTWRFKALEEDEESSPYVTWHGTPRAVVSGKLRCSFAESKNCSDFPRGEVEYLKVKFVRHATMGVDVPVPSPVRERPQETEPPVKQFRGEQRLTQSDWGGDAECWDETENVNAPPQQVAQQMLSMFTDSKVGMLKKCGNFKVAASVPDGLSCFHPHLWVERLEIVHVGYRGSNRGGSNGGRGRGWNNGGRGNNTKN